MPFLHSVDNKPITEQQFNLLKIMILSQLDQLDSAFTDGRISTAQYEAEYAVMEGLRVILS